MQRYSDKYYSLVNDQQEDGLTTEEKIVFRFIEDFTDRRGMGDEWDEIDDEIQDEIIETWIDIVKKQLKTN